MRRLYYVSDTHHELLKSKPSERVNIVPDSDINVINFLALCGDIGNPFNPNYLAFLQRHTDRFKHIFIISGNHEYYSNQKQRTIAETDAKIAEIASQFANVSALQKSTFQIDDVLFIGCTLWTKVDATAEHLMNDYTRIYVDSDRETSQMIPIFKTITMFGGRTKKKYMRPGRKLIRYKDVLDLHNDMKAWLTKTIEEPPETVKKIVVLTHHAPSALMLGTKPTAERNSELMSYRQDLVAVTDNCYSSNCERLIRSPVVCWISGHTHKCIAVDINGIQCLSNCFGYPGQKTGVDLTRHFTF